MGRSVARTRKIVERGLLPRAEARGWLVRLETRLVKEVEVLSKYTLSGL